MPLLDGGRHEAEVARANAELDVSLARHGRQILVALKDVEDHLSALRTLRGEAAALARAGEASARTARLVESNHRNGLASQLEIIDARRTELRSRRQALQAQAGGVHATVGLVRALGGGWDAVTNQAFAR